MAKFKRTQKYPHKWYYKPDIESEGSETDSAEEEEEEEEEEEDDSDDYDDHGEVIAGKGLGPDARCPSSDTFLVDPNEDLELLQLPASVALLSPGEEEPDDENVDSLRYSYLQIPISAFNRGGTFPEPAAASTIPTPRANLGRFMEDDSSPDCHGGPTPFGRCCSVSLSFD